MNFTQPDSKFTEADMGKVFKKLTSSIPKLKQFYESYLTEEYRMGLSERNSYYDIARIADFIKQKYKAGQAESFVVFFSNIEDILTNCDTYVNELIVFGLFEGIQDEWLPGNEYIKGFDKWLKPLSKMSWDDLINFWKGKEAK
jgi:hypothetical protein